MSYVRPSSTASGASWFGQDVYTRPSRTAAQVIFWGPEIRVPAIAAGGVAQATSMVWAVSVGTSNGAATVTPETDYRSPLIEASSFVVGTQYVPWLTDGTALGQATAQGYGDALTTTTGAASGTSSALAGSLVTLTAVGASYGSSLADGHGIFNKDFAGKCLASSSAQGRSLVAATSTGYCFGRASVLSNYRPRARVQRPTVPTFSTDGRATGTSFGRATVGRKPKWRKVPVLIPQFGNPAVGNIKASSRASGVSAHG